MVKGDLVRVVTQPTNQLCHIVGEVGIIIEKEEGYVRITTLHLDGSLAGMGSVPEDCLQPETRPEWHSAKQKYLDAQEKWRVQAEEHTAKRTEHLTGLAIKYGVPLTTLLDLEKDLSNIPVVGYYPT